MCLLLQIKKKKKICPKSDMEKEKGKRNCGL